MFFITFVALVIPGLLLCDLLIAEGNRSILRSQGSAKSFLFTCSFYLYTTCITVIYSFYLSCSPILSSQTDLAAT